MDLGEPGRVLIDAEQHFVADGAAGNGGNGLTEQQMALADLDAELSFQRGPSFRSRDDNPWFRKRPRFPDEQVVNQWISASVTPGPSGSDLAPGKPAARRTAPQSPDVAAVMTSMLARKGLPQRPGGQVFAAGWAQVHGISMTNRM